MQAKKSIITFCSHNFLIEEQLLDDEEKLYKMKTRKKTYLFIHYLKKNYLFKYVQK